MEINTLPSIKVKDFLAFKSIPLAFLRRLGAQLVPGSLDWYKVDRSTWLSLDVAFLIYLVNRLSYYEVLTEDQIVAALGFFRERIFRFVLETITKLEKNEKLPISSLEVLEKRWVRVGEPDILFDLEEFSPITPLELTGTYNYSASICLLPLLLELNALRTNVNNSTKRTSEEAPSK